MAALYVVNAGDSLTIGTGATGWGVYPLQLALLYKDNRMVSITNVGISSAVIAGQAPDMTALAATIVDPEYDSRKGKNVLVVWAGTNDIYFGASPALAYSRLVAYCQARQAVGYKVVVVNCLSRSGFATPGDFNTSRATFNASVTAGWPTFASALADIAANGLIGYNGAELDLTYFSNDTTHMNSTGYGVVASIVKPAVDLANA